MQVNAYGYFRFVIDFHFNQYLIWDQRPQAKTKNLITIADFEA